MAERYLSHENELAYSDFKPLKFDPDFKLRDAATRKLCEMFGNKVHIDLDRGSSFGPIQGFVLRKVG